MKIKILTLVLALLSSAFAYADDSDGNVSACRQDGGMPIQMQLQIDAGTMVSSGEPRWFCLFNNSTGSRSELIDAATLSSTNPSLAATAYRNAPKITIPTGARADLYYCQALSGTALIGASVIGGYADSPNASEYNLCMFEDGSSIDTWSLLYQRYNHGAAVDLTPYFKSPVLPLPPSVLWGHASN